MKILSYQILPRKDDTGAVWWEVVFAVRTPDEAIKLAALHPVEPSSPDESQQKVSDPKP